MMDRRYVVLDPFAQKKKKKTTPKKKRVSTPRRTNSSRRRKVVTPRRRTTRSLVGSSAVVAAGAVGAATVLSPPVQQSDVLNDWVDSVNATRADGAAASVQAAASTPADPVAEDICATVGGRPAVVLYAECDFKGDAYVFYPGRYAFADLEKSGVRDNTISSVRLCNGAQAILHDLDNFGGNSFQVTQSVACLSEFNDLTTSLQVLPPQQQQNAAVVGLPDGGRVWFGDDFDESTGKWLDAASGTDIAYLAKHSAKLAKRAMESDASRAGNPQRAALFGTPETAFEFGQDILKGAGEYTVVHVTRYAEAGAARRVVTVKSGQGHNWLSGFHASRSGVCYQHPYWVTNTRGNAFGSNWVISVTVPGMHRANGMDMTTTPTRDKHVVPPSVSINGWDKEESAFGIACMMIFPRVLSIDEIAQTETTLSAMFNIPVVAPTALPLVSPSWQPGGRALAAAFFAETYAAGGGSASVWKDSTGSSAFVMTGTSAPMKQSISPNATTPRAMLVGSVNCRMVCEVPQSSQAGYTVVHVARYAPKTGVQHNRRRIVTLNGVLPSGHADGFSGAVSDTFTPDMADGIDQHGNGWVISVHTPTTYRSNGVTRSPANASSGVDTLTKVGVNAEAGNESDFALACLLVYSGVLAPVEVSEIESALSSIYDIPLQARQQQPPSATHVRMFLHGDKGHEIVDVGFAVARNPPIIVHSNVQLSREAQPFDIVIPGVAHDSAAADAVSVMVHFKNDTSRMPSFGDLNVRMHPYLMVNGVNRFNGDRISDLNKFRAKRDTARRQLVEAGVFAWGGRYMIAIGPNAVKPAEPSVFARFVKISSSPDSKPIAVRKIVAYDLKGDPIGGNVVAELQPQHGSAQDFGPHLAVSARPTRKFSMTGGASDAYLQVDFGGAGAFISRLSVFAVPGHSIKGCAVALKDVDSHVVFAANFDRDSHVYEFEFKPPPLASTAIKAPQTLRSIPVRYVSLVRTRNNANGNAVHVHSMTVTDDKGQVIGADAAVASVTPQYGSASQFGPQFVFQDAARPGGRSGFPHTAPAMNASITIDLKRTRRISSVAIENRKDCCKNRIVGTSLVLSDESGRAISKVDIAKAENSYLFEVGRPFCAEAARQYATDNAVGMHQDPWSHYVTSGASAGMQWKGEACGPFSDPIVAPEAASRLRKTGTYPLMCAFNAQYINSGMSIMRIQPPESKSNKRKYAGFKYNAATGELIAQQDMIVGFRGEPGPTNYANNDAEILYKVVVDRVHSAVTPWTQAVIVRLRKGNSVTLLIAKEDPHQRVFVTGAGLFMHVDTYAA